jgi:hypothetical protein
MPTGNLVFVTQWGTNIDNYRDEPSAARYLDRLASFSLVILFESSSRCLELRV